MKKKIFVFLAVSSLTLTGCSLSGTVKGLWNGFLEFVGIRKPAEEEKPKDEEHHGEEPGDEEEWTKTYSSNAYEHWYLDEDGNEVRESHEFKLKNHTDKTCTETDHDEYECEECGYTKIVNGHELAEHKYSSRTIQPTCKETGKIIFECSECGEKHETILPIDSNAHNFVSQGTEGGVTTFKCSICDETKVVMDYTSQAAAENVSTEALQQVDEIKLQNASIAFDESIFENDLGDNVNISAEAKEPEAVAEELSLPAEDQEKLAGKPIVDFSVTNSGSEEKISEFSGKVKVTIPYELQKGENPEGIAIWYLSANNEPEAIKAQYANGNVSFETDHFSYYAVVHLSPEEACEKFGHEMVGGTHANSTCVAHGYDESICRRCNKTERTTLPLIPHTYECTERVDATLISEGLVHYECKVCKDAYDVIIPKVQPTGRGFYTNLLYSAMTPDWRTYSSTTEDGVNNAYESFQGLDNEGMPFTYSSSGYATYKGYSYNDYRRNETYSSSSFNSSMQVIRDYIDYIPQIYKDKLEEFGTWLVDNYFIREDVTEGYKFSVDYNKVAKTYEDFRDKSLKDAIIATIGQENFDGIYNFVMDHYEDTVDEFIQELNRRGYVVKALYDAIMEVNVLHGADPETIVSFEEAIKDIKDMKITALIEQYLSMIMGGGSSSGGSSVGSDEAHGEPSQSEPVKPEEPIEVDKPEQDKSRGILPETIEEFKEKADEFLDGNLFDFISGMTEMSKDTMVDMADSVVDVLKEGHAQITLKTSKDGGFLSLETLVQDFEIGNLVSVEYGYSLMTKDYDKASVLKEIQKEVDKYEFNKAKFTLDETNYEWFSKPFEDYYKEKYPTFKLSYVRNYSERYENCDALVSNVEVQSQRSEWDHETQQYVYKTGKLVILVRQPGWYHSSYNQSTGEHIQFYESEYGSVVRNYNGFGTLLKKDEQGLKQESYRYVQTSYVEVKGGSEDLTEPYYMSVPEFEYLLRVSDKTMHTTKAGGTFDYLNYGFEKPVLSSFEEWDAYYAQQYPNSTWVPSESYKDSEEYGERIVIKTINQIDGRINFYATYDYDGKNREVFSTYVLSKDMNDEALESISSFRVSYGLKNGKLLGYIDQSGKYNPFEDYYHFDKDEVDNNINQTTAYGNVVVTLNAPKGTPACTRTMSWKISANGKTVISGSYKFHMNCYYYEHNETTSTPIDSCHTSYHEERTCTLCNKVLSTNDWISDNHNWDYEHEVRTEVLPRTLTRAGIEKVEHECLTCGEHDVTYYYKDICRHYGYGYNEGTHMIHCPECGYEVESETGDLPALIYEPLVSEKDGTIAFSMFSPRYHTWWIDDYYSFYLCAGYFDDNGDFCALTNGNESDVNFTFRYFDEEYQRYVWGTLCRALYFSESAYSELVEEARKEAPEGVEIVPTVAAVSKDDGTVFYYAIY